jgi:hypothetical protein
MVTLVHLPWVIRAIFPKLLYMSVEDDVTVTTRPPSP